MNQLLQDEDYAYETARQSRIDNLTEEEFKNKTNPPHMGTTKMKLYNCKKGDKVRLYEDANIPPAHRTLPLGEVLTFDHVDGMYSLCRDADGNYVHPAAWTEVIVIPKEPK